jgi:hypothetical protein
MDPFNEGKKQRKQGPVYIKPESYKISRDLFIKDLTQIQTFWSEAKHSFFVVSEDEKLTIDWISANAVNCPEKLFFLTTGLHGVEGYLGSIMMQLFIKEFLPLMDPKRVGILLVHCINPSGMNNRYRTNPANVDLNRNFIDDFSKMQEINPDYPKLDPFFNPKHPVRNEFSAKFIFIFQTLKLLAQFGSVRIREAALMGQYFDPSGMYFGGLDHQPETNCLMNLIHEWIPKYQKTLHLDMHTGYGPRNQMTLVQTPVESRSSRDAKEQFGIPLVAATNPEEFYQIHGEMADFIYKVANDSDRKVYSAAFEFGTYGDGLVQGARSLLTTIVANQLQNYQFNFKSRNWVHKDYDELYFPSEPAWLDSAIQNGRQAFKGILSAEGFI